MKKCFICWSNFEFYSKWGDSWHKTTKKVFSLYKCNKCGLEKIEPTPDFQEQTTFYPDNYYSYNLKSNKQNILYKINNFFDKAFWIFEKDYFNIADYTNWNWKSFLEIWCWDGFLLKKMEWYWWQADGFEIGSSEKKNNIYYSHAISEVKWNKKYDLILLKHVFEHVDSPQEYLKTIGDLLTDEGICLFIQPNTNSLSSLVFWSSAAERDIPRHLYNYNYTNFEELLSQYFVIDKKWYLRQWWLLHSLLALIRNKTGYDLSHSYAFKLCFYWFILIELFLTMLWYTNQMAFIVKKK